MWRRMHGGGDERVCDGAEEEYVMEKHYNNWENNHVCAEVCV